MKFWMFIEQNLPRTWTPGDEHRLLKESLEQVELAAHLGFDCVWIVEHHFLRQYSHMSSPEVFLSFVAARTSRIHLGSAIFNITAPVNHPVRTAERAAMLDNLSNGRFELGTGRGSSSTEMLGFEIPEMDASKVLWDEAIREIPKMWKEGFYSYEGQSFSVPPREVFPKPPLVPDWPAVMPEPTVAELEEQVEAGIIAIGDPDDCARVMKQYEDAGADQVVVSPMTTTMPFDVAVESMRLFGEHVIPRFDTDPEFRSDRMRTAALVT